MKKLLTKLTIVLFILSLVSCASKKDVLYFQDIDDLDFELLDSLTTTTIVESGDILRIRITALETKSLIPFQFDKPGMEIGRSSSNIDVLQLNGYLVDKNGDINFPELGRVNVAGRTIKETEEHIHDKLSNYIKKPTVSVRVINTKVTVMGDVRKPGTFSLSEERLTLPQAIGLAGDLN